MQGRGAKVLSDGEDVATGINEILHRFDDLVKGLAHAKDEVRFGDHPRFRRERDEIERALVTECGTNLLKDARNSFEVMGKHLGL